MTSARKSRMSADERDQVITIWKDVLGQNTIDLDRGFADLGGTSLAANQFVARLSAQIGLDVPVIRVFEYPTLRLLLRYLAEGASPPTAVPGPDSRASDRHAGAAPDGAARDGDIAIIGMACRFPGARNLEEFWANLLDGRDTITILDDAELSPEVPAELRSDPRYVRAAGLIDSPYAMDAEFFGINPMEAKLTDPQQRVLLETAWHALEHAGEGIGSLPERTAVFAGTEDNSYYRAEIAPFPQAESRAGRFAIMTGNEKDYVAMRIAHKLNLKGPAISVHTACSTSLVAVIMAAKSLRHGECDLALAGGASVHFPTPEGYYFQEGGVFSSDGHCRPFDAAAEGTNFTDGSGVVVLKRLADAIRDHNTVFAIIKGGAINSDGGEKVSFSAPSVAGQAGCIRAALADAGVDASTIQYVEAHGTATPVGDPIELEGLRQAFALRSDPQRRQYCGLGSVKSNIGHTTAAAGVASLIKTALALSHGVIPATVHFEKPNPGLDIENSPFYIVDRKLDWPRGEPARRAGISSFGIGGTNSHLILEEAPALPERSLPATRPFEIWPVSARSPSARDRLLADLSQERYWPRDVAYTLQNGRTRFRYRGARVRLTEHQIDDLLVQPAQEALEEPRLVFMFPGQGSQYIEMGRSLHEQFPEFRTTFDRCADVLSRELGLDFKAFIFDPANQETLENTRYTQPALFAIEVSLGRMLLDWGIEPDFLVGHSIGEFAAAHLAGVFSLDDALKLIAARGRLMADLPRGRMLSVRGDLDAVLAAAGEPVDIASINGPVHSVLAGDIEQMSRVQTRIGAAGIPCRPLHTSHAFHSAMMDPVVPPFLAIVRSVQLHAPTRALISTVTGLPMSATQASDPLYWANHLRATVRFSPALLRSIELGANVFLEVGPRTTLASLAVQHFAKTEKGAGHYTAIALLGDEPDAVSEVGGIGVALGKLWCAGIELPWERVWGGGRRVPLVSSYPFERREYRFSEGRKADPRPFVEQASEPVETATDPGQAAASDTSQGSEERLAGELGVLFGDYSGLAVTQLDASFVECGFDSLVLMQIGIELGKKYGVSIALRDLMASQNTLRRLAAHLIHAAPAEKIQHLKTASTRASAGGRGATARPPGGIPATPPDQPPARAGWPLTAAAGGDAAGAVREHLRAVRDFIDRQLQELSDQEGAGLAAPATAAREAVRVTPRIKGGEVKGTEAPSERPLIRARHAQPPEPGAFRAPLNPGEGEWFVFQEDARRYRRLDH